MLTEWLNDTKYIYCHYTLFMQKHTSTTWKRSFQRVCINVKFWETSFYSFTTQIRSTVRSHLPFLRDTKRRVRPWTAWWCRSGWSSNPRPRKRHPHSRWQPKELNTFIWKCHFSVNNKMSERNLQNTWGSV